MEPLNTQDEDVASDVGVALATAVTPWVEERRWCPACEGLTLIPKAVLTLSESPWAVILLATVGEGGPLLQIPLTSTKGLPPIGEFRGQPLTDGTSSPEFWEAWARAATLVSGDRDALVRAASKVRPLGVEQSNTSVFLEGGPKPLIAKVFRVLHPGENPEVELPRALTEADWPGVPRLWAYWNLPILDEGGPLCSAVVSEAVANAKDGFDLFTELASSAADPAPLAHALGRTTAQMHGHLAAALPTGLPLPRHALAERIRSSIADAVEGGVPGVGTNTHLRERIGAFLAKFSGRDADSARATTRIHGDLHLGQTLRGADDNWYVLDFEGEPLRDIEARATLDDPLRDVAGMLRSFDYAWSKAHEGQEASSVSDWTTTAQRAFLDGYQSLIPLSEDALELLTVLQIEKAIYEADYERRFRPHYLPVPIAALEALTNPPATSRT